MSPHRSEQSYLLKDMSCVVAVQILDRTLLKLHFLVNRTQLACCLPATPRETPFGFLLRTLAKLESGVVALDCWSLEDRMSAIEYLAILKAGLAGQHGSVGLYSALQRCFIAFGLAAAPTCWLIGELTSLPSHVECRHRRPAHVCDAL